MTQRRILILSAGIGEPSSTTMLANRLAQRTLDLLHAGGGGQASVSTVELRGLAEDVGRTLVSGITGERLQDAIDRLAAADAVIVATPVYKAGMSGLFKSFVDVLDDDLLIAKPVALAATGGSSRHAMVPDEQMRPLFAYLRAIAVPTALFAAPEDWGEAALARRIDRAATELAALTSSDVTRTVVDGAWQNYRHDFGSAAQREIEGEELEDIDLDTDLMHLATGGGANRRQG